MSRKIIKEAIDNLDSSWDFMSQREKQVVIRTLVDKVIITNESVKIELSI